MRRGPTSTRTLIAAAAAVALWGATACAPTPPPTPGGTTPSWVGSGFTRVKSATQLEQFIDSWTSDEWYAHVRFHADIVAGVQQPGTTDLQIFPRSGAGGATLGAPQVISLPVLSNFAPLWGESFLGVQTATDIEFLRPVAGVWAPSGSVAIPAGFAPNAMSDEWLAFRKVGQDEYDIGQILIYELSDVAGSIVASPHTTLDPEPTWPQMVKNTFGFRMSLDGDLLALSAIGENLSDDLVRVYRNTGGTWAADFTFTDASATTRFAEALAVTDGPSVDRLAMPHGVAGQPAFVDVFADSGAGFALEESVARPTGLPGDTSSPTFGFSIGLDGDVLAVGTRLHLIAVPGIAAGEGTAGVVDIFRHGTSWEHEAELATWDTPSGNDMDSTLPWVLEVSGEHVAVTVLGSPSPGCGFLCINLGFESWVFDQTG